MTLGWDSSVSLPVTPRRDWQRRDEPVARLSAACWLNFVAGDKDGLQRVGPKQ